MFKSWGAQVRQFKCYLKEYWPEVIRLLQIYIVLFWIMFKAKWTALECWTSGYRHCRSGLTSVRPDGAIDRNIAQWNCEKIGFTKSIFCYLDELFVWCGLWVQYLGRELTVVRGIWLIYQLQILHCIECSTITVPHLKKKKSRDLNVCI